MGVAPLWPLSRSRISLSLTRAANPVANYALLVAGVLASGAGLLVAAG
jgi:inner membrane protein